jgi:LacI family transcriptional regulator
MDKNTLLGHPQPALRKRVTLKDVAKSAGVASNTVSVILNRKAYSWASPETSARVFKAAYDLGYVPNYLATSLKTARAQSIGLVIPDMANIFNMQLAQVLLSRFKGISHHVIVEVSGDSLENEVECVKSLAYRCVDGVIGVFINGNQITPQALGPYASVPLVGIVCPDCSNSGMNRVMVDFEAAILEGFERMAARGVQKYTYFSTLNPGELDSGRSRLFHDILTRNPAVEVQQIHTNGQMDDIYRMVKTQRWDLSKRHGIIALNDMTAIPLVRALQECGHKIGETTFVMSFDDIFINAYLPIALSSVAQPYEQIAQAAFELLQRRMANPNQPPENITLKAKFVSRETL